MSKATLSTKGQIAIPKAVRDRLNLTEGTQLTILVKGESLVMKRSVSAFPDWKTMRGMARGTDSLTQALTEERAAEKARDEARVQGR